MKAVFYKYFLNRRILWAIGILMFIPVLSLFEDWNIIEKTWAITIALLICYALSLIINLFIVMLWNAILGISEKVDHTSNTRTWDQDWTKETISSSRYNTWTSFLIAITILFLLTSPIFYFYALWSMHHSNACGGFWCKSLDYTLVILFFLLPLAWAIKILIFIKNLIKKYLSR